MTASSQSKRDTQSRDGQGGATPLGTIAVHASDAIAPTVKRAAKPAARRFPSLVLVIAGFVAGVGFWHFIGFWSFVNGIVYKDERPAMHDTIDSEDGRKLPTTLLGGIPPADSGVASACTTLRLDRVTNRTMKAPCDAVQTAAPALLPRAAESPKLADVPKSAETPKAAESSKAAEAPKPVAAPKSAGMPPARKPSVAGWSVIIKDKKN